MCRESACSATTRPGARILEDDLGTLHAILCDSCRSIRIDSNAPGQKACVVTHVRAGAS